MATICRCFTLFYMAGVLLQSVDAVINVNVSPKAVSKKAKEPVYIDCNVIPRSTGVRVTWKKDNKNIPYYSKSSQKDAPYVFAENNTLYIASLKRRHTGRYECEAFSQSSNTRTIGEATIEIKYIQKLAPIEPVRSYVGTDAEIVCKQPLANPFAKPSWLFNGAEIKSDRIDSSDWTLSIKNVSLADEGIFTCVATNDANVRTENATFTPIVKGPVEVKPVEDTINEGEATEFTCVSKAKPPLEVTWKRAGKTCNNGVCNDEVVIETSDDDRVKVENGVLSINEAIPSDKGKYVCEASLGSSLDRDSVLLNVEEYLKEDPVLHQRFQSIDAREKDGTIFCQFRGDGEYTITWSRFNSTKPLRDGITTYNNTLKITGVTFDDAGTYLCTANGVKNSPKANVTLTVYESPVFSIHPNNVSQNEGKSAWIDCKGEGTPTPRVSYHKNKQTESLNASHFVQMPNGTLYIEKLKKEDTGTFYCWLTQKAKIEYSTFYIKVKDAELITPGSSSPMGRTVGIAVGCAGVYILLVIGLMIYCRARRARLLKKGLITEADPLVNGEDIPLSTNKSLDYLQVPKENITEICDLGHGKLGRVYKGLVTNENHPNGELCAVKEFSEQENGAFNSEMEFFLELNHDNVVKLIGIQNNETPHCLIIEHSEIGNLKDHLVNNPSLTDDQRINMALDIASGMEYLISLRYIHRNLSTRNCIAMNNENVKVTFLSLCEDVYKDDYYLLNNVLVPLRWLSPEAITNEVYSEKSDVWSYGVTLWEIFSNGKQPYSAFDDEQVRDGICKDLRLTVPEKCPPEISDLMKNCWADDAAERPTFKDIVQELNKVVR